jgi:hypothetical protein
MAEWFLCTLRRADVQLGSQYACAAVQAAAFFLPVTYPGFSLSGAVRMRAANEEIEVAIATRRLLVARGEQRVVSLPCSGVSAVLLKPKEYFAYVLQRVAPSARERMWYIGSSMDAAKRVEQHQIKDRRWVLVEVHWAPSLALVGEMEETLMLRHVRDYGVARVTGGSVAAGASSLLERSRAVYSLCVHCGACDHQHATCPLRGSCRTQDVLLAECHGYADYVYTVGLPHLSISEVVRTGDPRCREVLMKRVQGRAYYGPKAKLANFLCVQFRHGAVQGDADFMELLAHAAARPLEDPKNRMSLRAKRPRADSI